jgi:hypothetical protein
MGSRPCECRWRLPGLRKARKGDSGMTVHVHDQRDAGTGQVASALATEPQASTEGACCAAPVPTLVALWFKSPSGAKDVDARWVTGRPGGEVKAVFENFKYRGEPLTVQATLPLEVPAGHIGAVAAEISVSEKGVLQERIWATTQQPGCEPTSDPPTPTVNVGGGKRRVTFSDGKQAVIEE